MRVLFSELWNSAQVLTPAVAETFADAHHALQKQGFDPEAEIRKVLGRVQPTNIAVGSEKKSKKRLFLDDLQRRNYEQYRPAFSEVKEFLASHEYHRPELSTLGPDSETNRFLNWVRLEKAPGNEWKNTAPLNADERAAVMQGLGAEWKNAPKQPGTPNLRGMA